eukprot:1681314-Pleurochrysis_carterae.AAC.3
MELGKVQDANNSAPRLGATVYHRRENTRTAFWATPVRADCNFGCSHMSSSGDTKKRLFGLYPLIHDSILVYAFVLGFVVSGRSHSLQLHVCAKGTVCSSLWEEFRCRTLTSRLARAPCRHKQFCASGNILHDFEGRVKLVLNVAAISVLARL